MAIKPK